MTFYHAEVYSDGSCDPNPGPGGWGAVVRWEGREWRLSGNEPATTNNRMELQAAAAALSLLEGLLGRCQVDVYTDSRYLQEGIGRPTDREEDDKPLKNRDLWLLLHRLNRVHSITWHRVQAHHGHPLNELADRLAVAARRRWTVSRQADDDDALPPVLIYIQATCRGARGPGGWGAVVRDGEQVRLLGEGAAEATANQLLLRGAATALRTLDEPRRVIVHSDSVYLILGASRWAKDWRERGWRTGDGRPVANRGLWEELLAAAARHRITRVRGAGEAEMGPDDLALARRQARLHRRDDGNT